MCIISHNRTVQGSWTSIRSKGQDGQRWSACLGELGALVDGPGRVDLAAYIPLNVELHRLIVDAAANDALTSAVDRVTALPFASPGAFVSVQAELDGSQAILARAQARHREVVAAVLSGDAEHAEFLAPHMRRLRWRTSTSPVAT